MLCLELIAPSLPSPLGHGCKQHSRAKLDKGVQPQGHGPVNNVYTAACLRSFVVCLYFGLLSWTYGLQTLHHFGLSNKYCFLRLACPTGTLCIDAFIVAINNASGGWYVSMLELQLTSLRLCSACRGVSTLWVRVDEDTPERLWARTGMQTTVQTRVVPLRALGIKWGLSASLLPHDPTQVLLFQRVERFELSRSVKLDGVTLPPGLEQLTVCEDDWDPWPRSYGHDESPFGDCMSSGMDKVAWPVNLQQLTLCGTFNHPIAGIAWPPSLLKVSFGYCFNQSIVDVRWPASPQHVEILGSFDKPIVGVAWPALLQKIALMGDFNKPIQDVVWPVALQSLEFGYGFNQPIHEVSWPASLQTLTFTGAFDRPIDKVVWPPCLQTLAFGDRFDQPIVDVAWPVSLRNLQFGGNFNRPIVGVVWPASLCKLTLAYEWFHTVDTPGSVVVVRTKPCFHGPPEW